MQSGDVFQQPKSEPITKGIESGLSQETKWPTPTTQEIEHPNAILTKSGRRKSKDGKSSHSLNLADTVKMMWPTPTTFDTKKDSLKHATKLIQGKTHRASGEPIQKSLVDKVMMEEIKKNPELMKIYQDHEMIVRPNLPLQEEFVMYMRQQTSIKELVEKTKIKKTTIEHWFRKDKKGFSYPSVEDWKKIKPHLRVLKYDQEMTFIQTKEWQTKKQMWPTPDANMGARGTQENWTKIRPSGQLAQYTLNQAVRDSVKMWPTPTATEARQGYQDRTRGKKGTQKSLSTEVIDNLGGRQKTGGQLNPTWVEWLMGWPLGWTDLKELEMDKFQKWLELHGRY
tara:strand:- start:361 stop:1377 length:1017 start_codon:yes stop_codon:yes gene_type:complete